MDTSCKLALGDWSWLRALAARGVALSATSSEGSDGRGEEWYDDGTRPDDGLGSMPPPTSGVVVIVVIVVDVAAIGLGRLVFTSDKVVVVVVVVEEEDCC